MTGTTRIWTDIDLDGAGRQVGTLHLPHSVTRSAYGTIAIPVAVFRNGDGPTVLLMAGNHGDEYEGQVALCRLIRTLDPARLSGRVIVLPAVNLPAAMAGTRVSPLDDVNLNRAFPGEAAGTPTRAIAHYLDSVLFPMADVVHDFHSGGSSLDYLAFASAHTSGDAALDARSVAALRAFGAPLSLVWKGGADPAFASGACLRHGVPYLGGEFGGSGRVSRAGVALAERGLRRLLAHAGVLRPEDAPAPEPVRMVAVGGRDFFVYAPAAGLFEPATELGDTVGAGDLCGEVHFVDDPARAPVPCLFRTEGFVVCKRHFGRVERGDCVAHLAVDA